MPELMNQELFWQLISTANEKAKGDDDKREKLLIESLATQEAAQIIEFECIMRAYLLEADDFKIIAAEKIVDGSVSDDSYLYFRCWLIAQGEIVFKNAMHNPDTLANVVEPFCEFESLLYVATSAYEQRTGKIEEDDTYPRSIASARGLDYDFGAVTKGAEWTEEQLPTLLPVLYAKFGGNEFD